MHFAISAAHRLARSFALALAASLLLIGATFGDDAADKAELDQLFAHLRDAPDAATAHEIDQRIWTIWTSPSDSVLARLMLEAAAAQSTGNVQGALLILDQIVTDYPTYAEGWNRRATLYYLMDNFEASLADIDKVLEFEPRHFGALSGRVLIYLAQGKRSEALRDMAAALAIHPFLSERQLFPELQEDMVRI